MTTAIRTKIVAATLLAGFGCAPAEDATDRTEAGAAASAAEEMASASGVEGLVTLGPVCPVVELGKPCPDRPYQTTMVIRETGSDQVVATVSSGEDGSFRVDLALGAYVLEPEASNLAMVPTAEPVGFTVEAGAYTQVEVKYESGIR